MYLHRRGNHLSATFHQHNPSVSYITSSAFATCTIAELDSTETAALAVYDYLVNHPDEIPEGLDDEDTDSDGVVEQIETYLSLDGDELTISYDSESDSQNNNSEVFDFLSGHFACLQTSLYMKVQWSSTDRRTGTFGVTDYYDRQGKIIDIHALLTAHLAQRAAQLAVRLGTS